MAISRTLAKQFIKSGDVQGLILAYELEAQRQKEQMTGWQFKKEYNQLTFVQRETAYNLLEKGLTLGIKPDIIEEVKGVFKHNRTSDRDGFVYFEQARI